MQASQPFRRFNIFAGAVASIMALASHLQGPKLAALGSYKSRGKGKGQHSGKSFRRQNRNNITRFISAKQDAKTYSRQYTIITRSGFEIMQTRKRVDYLPDVG